MTGVLVEFFGSPASGKSTLARAAAAAIDRPGRDVVEPSYVYTHEVSDWQRYALKGGHAFRTLATAPAYSLRTARSVLTSDQRTRTDLVKGCFNWFYLTDAVRNADADVTILDQGLFQAAQTIALSAGSEYPIEETLAPLIAAPEEYVVVVVEADESVLEERLASRTENESRVGSRYSVRTQLDVQDALLERIARSPEAAHVHFLRVRNEDEADLERNVSRIAERVERLLQSREDRVTTT